MTFPDDIDALTDLAATDTMDAGSGTDGHLVVNRIHTAARALRDQVAAGDFAQLSVSQADEDQARFAIDTNGIATWTDGTAGDDPIALARTGPLELTLTADLIVYGNATTTLDPTAAGHLTTKSYVDSVAAGTRWVEPVRVATTGANITINTKLIDGQTLDALTLATGDRVLVKDQATTSANGIYVVAASGGTPARADDANSSAELDKAAVYIAAGTLAGTTWAQTTASPVVNTDPIVWRQTSAGATIADDTTTTKTGSTLSVKAAGIGTTQLANEAVTPAKLAANNTSPSAGTYYRGDGKWASPSSSTSTGWTVVAAASTSSSTNVTNLHAARDAAAANAAYGTNGVVYVPDGTYTVNATITLNQDRQTWLLAPGAVIKADLNVNGSGKLVTPLTITADDITITGGIIDGAWTARTGKDVSPGVSINKAARCHLRDVEIRNAGTWAVYAQNTTGLHLEGCRMLQPGSNGVLHTTNTRSGGYDTEDIWIDGCLIDRTEYSDATLNDGGIKIIGDQNNPDDYLGAAVTVSTGLFTYADHELGDGDRVRVTNLAGPTSGLTAATVDYYVRDVTASTFKLAASRGGAAITGLGGTNGTADILLMATWGTSAETTYRVAATTNISTDTFTATGHGMTAGWRVQVEELAATTGIATGTDYYVINTAANTFQLAATRGGAAINLTGTNGTCLIRWGLNRLRRVKVTGCDVRLPDLIDDSGPGGGNESIMCQEANEAQVLFAHNTTRGGSMGISISGPADVAINGNVCTRFSKHGIELAAARHFAVTGNVIDGERDLSGSSPQNGIVCWVESSDSNRYPRFGTITGNAIRGLRQSDTGRGIRLSDPSNAHDAEGSGAKRHQVAIVANTIHVGGGAYGIQLLDVSHVTVAHNSIDCAEAGSIAGQGIRVELDATSTLADVALNGNLIRSAANGIYLAGTGTVTDIVAAHNLIDNCTTVRGKAGTITYGDRCSWLYNAGSANDPGTALDLAANVLQLVGTATPNSGAGIAAGIGSTYLKTDGSTSTTLWVKTGAGNTAWTAK